MGERFHGASIGAFCPADSLQLGAEGLEQSVLGVVEGSELPEHNSEGPQGTGEVV